jgi:hypothetical protein
VANEWTRLHRGILVLNGIGVAGFSAAALLEPDPIGRAISIFVALVCAYGLGRETRRRKEP